MRKPPLAAIGCTLAAFLLLASSCGKRGSDRIRVGPISVYVRLEDVVRLHPYHIASSWDHRPFRVEPVSGRPEEPLRTGVFEFSLPPPSHNVPETTDQIRGSHQVLERERRSIVSTFERAESRRTPAVRLAEEKLPALEEQLARKEESIRESYQGKIEHERVQSAARIAQLRLKLLPQRAFESKDTAAKRREAINAEIKVERAKFADMQKQFEKQMQTEIDVARSQEQEEVNRILASEQELRRIELRPYYQAQLDAVEKDWNEQTPKPASQPPPHKLPDAIAPSAPTPTEPPLANAKQAPPPLWQNMTDLQSFIKEDSRTLTRQWANLYGYKLAGFAPVKGAHDRTEACLSWLVAAPWKRSDKVTGNGMTR